MHKGGLERVTDYAKAIEDCLAELKNAGAIRDESDLAAVGFKTIMAHGVTGCVRSVADDTPPAVALGKKAALIRGLEEHIARLAVFRERRHPDTQR